MNRTVAAAGNRETAGATVTLRVLALLGAFDADHRALTLTELAARAGLALPTAHRFVGELVEWGELTRVTPFTVTQPGRLRAQLRRVRRDGFAETHEEMSLGACSVAVPVRAQDGNVVAALGIVVPSLKGGRPRLVAALQVAAGGIGRSIQA